MKFFISFLFLCSLAFSQERLADQQWNFIADYCIDCHDADVEKGNINLDFDEINWQDPKIRHKWSDAYTMLERGKMPPKKKKKQPSHQEKMAFMDWLDSKLDQKNPIGGTSIHRLNQREYLNTVRSLFNMYDYKLPGGFPQDFFQHGFDTTSKSLVISPSHIEAYAESALEIADYLFPPITPNVPKKKWSIPAQDLTISYSSAYLVDGAMRLASYGPKTRNATWPTKFEAPQSGQYKIKLDLSSLNSPEDHQPILLLKSHQMGKGNSERILGEFKLDPKQKKTFHTEINLYQGENLLFYYKNSFFNYSDKKEFTSILESIFTHDPRLAAAWDNVDKIVRGGNGWARVKKAYIKENLNTKAYQPGTKKFKNLIQKAAGKNPVLTGETLVYKYFEEGPNIGIHDIKIEGPFNKIDDPNTLKQREITKKFIGTEHLKDVDLKTFFEQYLSQAFRRPAKEIEIQQYIKLVQQEVQKGHRLEEGFHLAIRTSLLSPHFLYRENGQGELSEFEFASRLSYFLSSLPPDQKLYQLALQNKLQDPKVLKTQIKNLIQAQHYRKRFIQDFSAQWLDTDLLHTIMPDQKLFKRFKTQHTLSMIEEVTRTFDDILINNKPTNDFIDPDFIYTSSTLGKEIYQLDSIVESKNNQLNHKVIKFPIKRGTRKGGLLSMPAVMMATANGVDTQPVLRGVWMLENIMGMPPPAPPKNVPALPPDTSGIKGPREKLAAHMKSESCASCHEDIDPMGFILENFDPVGRWRNMYPAKRGLPAFKIDATAELSNGHKFKDISDLKTYLIDNPEIFSTCLAEKLMIYGTGREMNYREMKIIKSIVKENIKKGNKFFDLLTALISSDVFKAR
jgi:hypothetical protein